MQGRHRGFQRQATMISRLIHRPVTCLKGRRTFYKLSSEDGKEVRKMASRLADLRQDVKSTKAWGTGFITLFSSSLVAYLLHLHTVEVQKDYLISKVKSHGKQIDALSSAVSNALQVSEEKCSKLEEKCTKLEAQLAEEKKRTWASRIFGK